MNCSKIGWNICTINPTKSCSLNRTPTKPDLPQTIRTSAEILAHVFWSINYTSSLHWNRPCLKKMFQFCEKNILELFSKSIFTVDKTGSAKNNFKCFCFVLDSFVFEILFKQKNYFCLIIRNIFQRLSCYVDRVRQVFWSVFQRFFNWASFRCLEAFLMTQLIDLLKACLHTVWL